MKVFQVTLERTAECEIYVMAESSEEARDAAKELAQRDWFDAFDTDAWADEVRTERNLNEWEEIWVGGEQGEWVRIADLKALASTPSQSQVGERHS